MYQCGYSITRWDIASYITAWASLIKILKSDEMYYITLYSMAYSMLRGTSISIPSVLHCRGVVSHICYIAGLSYRTFTIYQGAIYHMKMIYNTYLPFMLYSTAIFLAYFQLHILAYLLNYIYMHTKTCFAYFKYFAYFAYMDVSWAH